MDLEAEGQNGLRCPLAIPISPPGQAIHNNRRTQKLLERMQALTLKTILRRVPGVRKRK